MKAYGGDTDNEDEVLVESEGTEQKGEASDGAGVALSAIRYWPSNLS